MLFFFKGLHLDTQTIDLVLNQSTFALLLTFRVLHGEASCSLFLDDPSDPLDLVLQGQNLRMLIFNVTDEQSIALDLPIDLCFLLPELILDYGGAPFELLCLHFFLGD